MNLLSYFLVLSILSGQLIKFPLINSLGPILLDYYLILFSFLGVINLRFKLKKPPPFIIYGFLFIFVAFLALILTPLHLTFIEYFISFFYIVRVAYVLLFSWVVYSAAFAFRKQIFPSLLWSGMGISILGLLQFFFLPNLQILTANGWDPHYFRTVATFLDPNFAGAFFVLTLILLVQTFHQGSVNSLSPRVFYILFIITYSALLTTFSRSSYLMFLISSLTLSTIKKSKKIMVSTIILFMILLIGFQIYTQLVSKPRNINREQSASFRLNTWQQGLTIFQSSPILGVGFNSYKYAIREYNLADTAFLESRGSSSNDSSLLYVAATTGIVGLFFYSLFLISLMKGLLKRNLTLTMSLSGLFVHSFFTNSLFFLPILVWLLLTAVDTES